jgi:hypothetical protein
MANARTVKRASKTAQLVQRNGVRVSLNADFATALESYKKTILEKVLRSGAATTARTFYLAMRANVPVKEGDLYGAMYHWHDPKQSGQTKQVYYAGPNKRKAPHWAFIEYGHWLYNRYANGSWLQSKSNKNARGPQAHDLPGRLDIPVWVPAKPYIQPAWDRRDAAFAAGMEAMKRRAQEEL